MAEAALLCIGLIVATGIIHYRVLTATHRCLIRSGHPMQRRLLIALVVIMVTHILEVLLYAVGYGIGQALNVGGFSPGPRLSAMEVAYFSLVTYTSLGLGDIFPHGHLRLMAGVEALNGFLLISCSASLLFILMNHEKEKLR